jgi:hypothetical protein
MKYLASIALVLALTAAPAPAFAYTTKKGDGSACTTDSACHVYCDNGTLAGTMYWNGTRWSDGLRSDPDKDVVARQIVAAQGSSCK